MAEQVVAIRRAQSRELDEIARQFNTETSGAMGFDWQQWHRQAHSDDSFTYVLEQQTIAGFVSAGSAGMPDPDLGEILAVWLQPEFRRQGWGRKLLVRGLSVLKIRNFSTAQVFLDANYEPGVHLLRSLGFKVVDYQRQINTATGTLQQQGYHLDLKDYF